MIRRLPDGTFFDAATGMLLGTNGTMYGVNPTQAQLNRDTQLRAKGVKPIPNRGQHTETVVQIKNGGNAAQVILQPHVEALAVDPYGTGMQGLGLFPNLSDTTKKIVLCGGIVAAAAGIIWVQSKFGKGKQAAPAKKSKGKKA